MPKLLGEEKVQPEALEAMRSRGGSWAAYQNHALDSHNVGHLQFLKFGAGCTFVVPPEKYPADTSHGAGWRYLHVGTVNLETGEIKGITEDGGVDG